MQHLVVNVLDLLKSHEKRKFKGKGDTLGQPVQQIDVVRIRSEQLRQPLQIAAQGVFEGFVVQSDTGPVGILDQRPDGFVIEGLSFQFAAQIGIVILFVNLPDR